MVSKIAVQYVANTFPGMGAFYNEGVRKDRPNHQVMYRWEVSNRKHVCQIIDALIPYLVIKREQAYLLLEFCHEWKDDRVKHENTRRTSPKELQRREDFYLRMKKLNVVGAAATTN